MRHVLVLLPLLLAACHQPAQDTAKPAPTPSVDGYAAKVAALSPPLRAGVMLRAIRDAGQSCQQVIDSKPAAGASPPAWIATCDNHRQWVVGIAADGTATVTDAEDVAHAAS